jgi:cold shock CspA family protein
MSRNNSLAVYQKWGFGMAPLKPSRRQELLNAGKLLYDGVLMTKPLDQSAIGEISTIKGLFTRCYKQDQWDWFTSWSSLGFPELTDCKSISFCLAELRQAVTANQNQLHITKNLQYRGFCYSLKNLVQSTDLNLKEGWGFIYILSTRENPDLLKIGVTTRSLELRVKEINSATGIAIPFGVRHCWLVPNANVLEKIIHQKLETYRIRADREFFNIKFGEAVKQFNTIVDEFSLRYREIGTIKYLSNLERYGFLEGLDSQQYFFHEMDLRRLKFDDLTIGASVKFVPNIGVSGNVARDVQL